MLIGLCLPLLAQAASDPPSLSRYRYEIPAGTPVSAILQEEVSTEHAVLGQPVSALVAQDVYIGTKKVLSRADRLFGRITRLDPPIKGRNAVLQVTFDTLVLSTGLKIPISSWIHTTHPEHFWGGEITEGTKPEIVPYQVYRIGTYGRVMYYGPRKMGEHVRLLPGERMIVVLDNPVEIYAF